jgi:hypothetical protein
MLVVFSGRPDVVSMYVNPQRGAALVLRGARAGELGVGQRRLGQDFHAAEVGHQRQAQLAGGGGDQAGRPPAGLGAGFRFADRAEAQHHPLAGQCGLDLHCPQFAPGIDHLGADRAAPRALAQQPADHDPDLVADQIERILRDGQETA